MLKVYLATLVMFLLGMLVSPLVEFEIPKSIALGLFGACWFLVVGLIRGDLVLSW